MIKTCKVFLIGVIIDEDFTWSAHINRVKIKIASSVGILSKLRYYVNIETLIQVYHALVGSRLHYAIICWGAAAQTTLHPIVVIQNRAIRFISKTSRYTRLDNAYLNLRLLKLDDIYRLKLVEFMHDYQQGKLPPFFSNFIQNVNEIHSYNTRSANANNFRSVRCNTSMAQRSIKYRAPNYWNDIPFDIKQTESKSKLKKDFKNLILATY